VDRLGRDAQTHLRAVRAPQPQQLTDSRHTRPQDATTGVLLGRQRHTVFRLHAITLGEHVDLSEDLAERAVPEQTRRYLVAGERAAVPAAQQHGVRQRCHHAPVARFALLQGGREPL
jgi:hypothetical protein